MTTPRTTLTVAALAGALACTLAGCSGTGAAVDATGTAPRASSPASPGASPGSSAEAAGQGSSVSVTNCGREVSLDSSPQRVVTLYPSMTELLLELGVGGSIVGQANTDLSPASEELAEAVAAVPVLSASVPSKEALLALEPDLVVSDGEYWFDGERMQTMDELEQAGIEVYVNSGYCDQDVTAGSVDDVLTDLEALGVLFGVEDRAEELATEAQDTLAALESDLAEVEPVDTAMLSVFDGQVYALARGMYSSVLETGGGSNLFEDELPTDAYFGQVSVESVKAAAPEAIVFTYGTEESRATTEEEITRLLADTPAVRDGRLHGLPEAEFSGTLRSVQGAADLAGLLHEAEATG